MSGCDGRFGWRWPRSDRTSRTVRSGSRIRGGNRLSLGARPGPSHTTAPTRAKGLPLAARDRNLWVQRLLPRRAAERWRVDGGNGRQAGLSAAGGHGGKVLAVEGFVRGVRLACQPRETARRRDTGAPRVSPRRRSASASPRRRPRGRACPTSRVRAAAPARARSTRVRAGLPRRASSRTSRGPCPT